MRMVFGLLGWKRAAIHPSKRNTVLIRVVREANPSQRTEYRSHLASSRNILCIRRQHPQQTVHLTTAREPDCASDDNEQPKTGPSCRQRHSMALWLSSEAQSIERPVARDTVCPAWTCLILMDCRGVMRVPYGGMQRPYAAIRRARDPSTTLAALAPLRMTRSRQEGCDSSTRGHVIPSGMSGANGVEGSPSWRRPRYPCDRHAARNPYTKHKGPRRSEALRVARCAGTYFLSSSWLTFQQT